MKTARADSLNIYQSFLGWGISLILILMPFHGLISVVGGKLTGHMGFIQAWKEVLILLMLVVAIVGLLNKKINWLKLDLTNKCTMAILSVAALVAIFRPTDLNTTAFGVKTNLVPLILFGLAQLAAPAFSRVKLLRFLIWPAVIVSVVAILQVYFIPLSFLNTLGYSSSTINPTQLVDPALWFVRAFSTLGGPNQLGAYLILPTCLLLTWIIVKKNFSIGLVILLYLIALGLSFSRSAWLGMMVALLTSVFLLLRGRVRWLFVAFSILVLTTGWLIVSPVVHNSSNNTLQYVLMHGRVFEAKVEGSDAGRIDSAQKSLQTLRTSPFGLGLGSAGPASRYGKNPIITENWYLQIGLEMGMIGLLAFLVFFGASANWLYRSSQRGEFISTGLLAALIGILVANLFLHTWADSTLALVFFTAFGVQKGMVE